MVDTSLWVEALRSGGSKTAVTAVYDALDAGIVIINGMVRTEILRGVRREEFAPLADLLDAVVTVPFDRSTFDHAAKLGQSLQDRGVTIPTADLLVMASTVEQEAVLWHRDRHFELAAEVTDLRVVTVD